MTSAASRAPKERRQFFFKKKTIFLFFLLVWTSRSGRSRFETTDAERLSAESLTVAHLTSFEKEDVEASVPLDLSSVFSGFVLVYRKSYIFWCGEINNSGLHLNSK
jgi:hypothetical protein